MQFSKLAYSCNITVSTLHTNRSLLHGWVHSCATSQSRAGSDYISYTKLHRKKEEEVVVVVVVVGIVICVGVVQLCVSSVVFRLVYVFLKFGFLQDMLF